MTFPLYANVFYLTPKAQATALAVVDNKQQVKFTIPGIQGPEKFYFQGNARRCHCVLHQKKEHLRWHSQQQSCLW
jgi:hypothetical protein